MTTILDYRPEVAAAVADGSLDVGLPAAALASLRRINDKIEALTTPLSRVSSLSEAEALATEGETEYRRLGEQWVATLHDLGVSPSKYAEAERERVSSVQRLVLPDSEDNEQWQGVLDSEEGYVAWIKRQIAEEQTDDERQKNEILANETTGSFLALSLGEACLSVGIGFSLPAHPCRLSRYSRNMPTSA